MLEQANMLFHNLDTVNMDEIEATPLPVSPSSLALVPVRSSSAVGN